MNASVIMCKLHAFRPVLGLTVALLLSAGPATAALGERANSVAKDQKTLSAPRQSASAQQGYTVQEVKSDAVTLREYLSPEGIVFAIAWNGLIHPDLTPLLGAHAGEYEEALRQLPPKPGSRHLHVQGSRVIVEKWGNMRNLQGRAYIPTLLPVGVSVDEIQ